MGRVKELYMDVIETKRYLESDYDTRVAILKDITLCKELVDEWRQIQEFKVKINTNIKNNNNGIERYKR